MKLALPEFTDKEELIDYLVSNKSKLISQKKSVTKEADSIYVSDNEAVKFDLTSISNEAKQIKVRSIINTTKLLDSHGDVHLDQLWNKSLKEGKFYLVQEHDFKFSGIISDNVKAFTKQLSWYELGINYEGKTQALVFDSLIDKEANPFMFDKYKNGKVNQHSVGMQYVKMELAVNDDRYDKEFAIWEKYFNEIANKQDALDLGYFWAVQEAKIIEGSAVVKGSNFVTPTLTTTQTKTQPEISTVKEPIKITHNINDLMKFYTPKKHV
jgi:hypothetical protein